MLIDFNLSWWLLKEPFVLDGRVSYNFCSHFCNVTSKQGDLAGNDSSRRDSRERKFVE